MEFVRTVDISQWESQYRSVNALEEHIYTDTLRDFRNIVGEIKTALVVADKYEADDIIINCQQLHRLEEIMEEYEKLKKWYLSNYES